MSEGVDTISYYLEEMYWVSAVWTFEVIGCDTKERPMMSE